MEELTNRQKIILTLIAHEHINSAEPVGSKLLVERFNIGLSSATVRNEMSILTELGYLRQPHTSAGRVPTEKGYRFFVGRLTQENEIPISLKRKISHQFYQMRNDVEQWTRLAASILAEQSKAASLVTAPHTTNSIFKHVEYISTVGKQVLMVMVLSGGEVRQRIHTLENPVSQEKLSEFGRLISSKYLGLNANQIRQAMKKQSDLEYYLTKWMIDEIEIADAAGSGELFLDGITNVLAEPEFNDTGEARRALRLLEEKSILQELFASTILNGEEGSVQVLIGGDGAWEDLRQCSIVISRYGAPGIAYGTVGVLGPIRMAYGHTISAVRFMSGVLSELVTQSLVDEQIITS
jgi:heat-inducible transcriptional repressor